MADTGSIAEVSGLNPLRGDIWLTRLDPTIGNEIQKTRPCLVVSPDTMNQFLGTAIVMPMTTGNRAEPFRLESSFRNLPGLLLGDRIRSVSRRRLIKLLGRVDDQTITSVLAVLREMFEE